MGVFYLVLALLIQNSFAETNIDNEGNDVESRDILKTKPDDDIVVKEYQDAPKDWMDLFIGTNSNIFPTSSAALMAQATFSDKSPEEQLDEIKSMASEITKAIQNEMANLLSYAISITGKEECDNKSRKKRSIESPMDSTKLVMRLLKHIKSNNEYQNIAIEKMMSAQEIADKYGIEFNPDPEMLSDLAVVANEQAKEMSQILKDACELKNVTHKDEIPLANITNKLMDCAEKASVQKNTTVNAPNDVHDHILCVEPGFTDSDSFSKYNYYYNYPYESQIMAPPVHHEHHHVSPRPSFYDYISVNPTQEYYPYCSVEPATTIILPMDDPVNPEPELVGEEYEETISSKVFIDHEEEPGVSTVNHESNHIDVPSMPRRLRVTSVLCLISHRECRIAIPPEYKNDRNRVYDVT
ncbi:unnamed protein product, partial [Brenthis ino]